jgi:penicillin-binding protein 1C
MRLSWIIALLFLLTGRAFGMVFGMTSFDQAKSAYRPSDAVLLDRHGEVIHELRVDPAGRRLEWTNLENISPALVKAVIQSEDKRFYFHHGADWQALVFASLRNMFGSTKRGASTITMQLAALLDNGLKPKNGPRSIRQKWEQIKAACEIEKLWTKNQILEAYLNLVSYRGELQGIAAASRGIFDKEPGGLDEAETAILAALIRSPNAPPEKVAQRARLLAISLEFAIPPQSVYRLALDRLTTSYALRQRIDLAPHAARMLLHEGARTVTSTLDGPLQRFVLETLRQTIGLLSDQNVLDGAAIVVDNKTGDVLAYVGNVGSDSSAAYVDGAQARRQAGSTLKPFLYGLVIEKKIITAASLINDSPLNISTARGVYRPENYDKEFRGFVTARIALASSINIPAVRTLNLIGVNAFAAKLREFGFSGLRDSEYYGPSLALGTADVTLWELVNAYRTLANKGNWSKMRMSPRENAGIHRRALSKEAAFIISSILSDREARSTTFSLESALSTRFWTAVKTGTSKDMRDNWCIGYSERYTVGVWTGNFSGSPMWNVSGVSGAAPAWLEIMDHLHQGSTSSMPVPPDGIVTRPVIIKDGTSSSIKREFFIAGTEEGTIYANAVTINPKIVYPARDMVIAMDPDIPSDLQRIYFKISADDPTLQLKIDETILGTTPKASWQPSPGTHHLYLLSREGKIADQVSFEVR